MLDPKIISPRRVLVGSRNAPKVDAVRDAFAAYFTGVDVRGVEVESGVPDQPIGWEEIVRGAMNRAARAFTSAECDFGVGYEDGLVPVPFTRTGYVNFGCCAIFDGARHALGFSSGFEYPRQCTERAAKARVPVGDTFDEVFSFLTGACPPESAPSSLTIGNVGMLTGGRLVRRDYTRHAVLCALAQLRHPQFYREDA
jgi:inosine/xanthosine triphosphatase